MRIAVQPETALERMALLTRQVPIPVVHTLGGALLSRAVMVATGLGISTRSDRRGGRQSTWQRRAARIRTRPESSWMRW